MGERDHFVEEGREKSNSGRIYPSYSHFQRNADTPMHRLHYNDRHSVEIFVYQVEIRVSFVKPRTSCEEEIVENKIIT